MDTHNLAGREPPWEPVLGRKTGTVLVGFLEAQCEKSEIEELQGCPVLEGHPSCHELYLPKLYRVLRASIRDRSIHTCSRGRQKGTIVKDVRGLCSS